MSFAPPLTSALFMQKVHDAYGDAGVFAFESSCLTQADFDLGEDHCFDRIAPALEEELSAQNADLG